MGAWSELVLRQDLPESFVRSAMMMLSVVLSIGLLSQQDDTEISTRAKHELTNDMMKRAKGEGIPQRYSKSKPDDFLREV